MMVNTCPENDVGMYVCMYFYTFPAMFQKVTKSIYDNLSLSLYIYISI